MAWSRESREALSSPSVMTDEDSAGTLRALLHFVGGGDDGVVEGGAAGEAEVREAVLQAAEIGSEVLIEVSLIGEVDDEGLVAGIGGFDEVESGGGDGGALGAHGSRVIDEQADGDRGVLMLNGDDGLRDAVFGDLEVALVEAVDELALAVEDGAVQHDLFGVDLKRVRARGLLLRRMALRERRERAEEEEDEDCGCRGADLHRAGPRSVAGMGSVVRLPKPMSMAVFLGKTISRPRARKFL